MNPDDMSPEEIAKLQQEQCIFCKIISGQIPSKKLYEDDDCLVILDINPANEGHLILLPKKHYQIMPQIPPTEFCKLTLIAKKCSKVLLQGLQVKGTSVFIANGGVAGQKAPHFMIHIIPRTENDELFKLPKKEISKAKINSIKRSLIQNLSKIFGKNVVEEKKASKPHSGVEEKKSSKPHSGVEEKKSSKSDSDSTKTKNNDEQIQDKTKKQENNKSDKKINLDKIGDLIK